MDRREAIKRAALLSGYAISATALSSVWQSCQRDAGPEAEAWEPVFFSPEQGTAVAEISETILPATDTPGAKEVRVHEFVDQFAKDCLTAEEQTQLREGLQQLLADCQSETGKAFIDSSAEERLAFLNKQDADARRILEVNPMLPEEERPVFMKLKWLVLMGYFTSEKVGKEVTAFLPVPGKYEPCAPYEEGQPAWTI